MIYIILYWIYLFFISSIIGNSIVSIIQIKRPQVAIVPFLGILGITLLASMYAIFGGLSMYFELSLLFLSGLIFVFTRKDFLTYLKDFRDSFKHLNTYLKAIFILVFVMAALKSAGTPFILDNETYYIATIKWLDEFGFVPGLANLHVFLGQQSGWHMAECSLNLDYLYAGFNDLNGFCLVLANLYVLDKLNQYFQFRKLSSLIIGLFPLFYVLIFQFLSSPSPDLPIYLLTVLIVGEFFDFKESSDTSHIVIMLLLAIFAIFIKVTASPLLIFPMVAFLPLKRPFKRGLWLAVCTGFLAAFLFGLKNYIISGYIFYPLSFVAFDSVDWRLPQELLSYIVDTTKAFGFYMTTEDYLMKNHFELFLTWIGMPGLHGYFNKFWLLLLTLFPILLMIRKENKTFLLLYLVSVLQFMLLWFSSPQYRFYLGFLMLLVAVVLAFITYKRSKLINVFLLISMLLVFVTTFFNLNVTALTENESHASLKSFQLRYLVEPHEKTKYVEAEYMETTLDGMSLFVPENVDFFWAVGDCPLPCIQIDQYNYFKHYFKLVPAMRTDQLKDGFYSRKVSDANFELGE